MRPGVGGIVPIMCLAHQMAQLMRQRIVTAEVGVVVGTWIFAIADHRVTECFVSRRNPRLIHAQQPCDTATILLRFTITPNECNEVGAVLVASRTEGIERGVW